MLRIVRIAGIIICALFIGLAAHSLLEGNGERQRIDLTILLASFLAFVVLSFFEMTRTQRKKRHRREQKFKKPLPKDDVQAFSPESTDIYAMPETLEAWRKSRHSHPTKPRRRRGSKMTSAWLTALRVYCVIIPLAYAGLLVAYLPWDGIEGPGIWRLPFLFLALFLFSVTVGIGIFSMRIWGLVLGYLLVLCNLLLFPYGTVAAILLLLCLAGSSPIFFTVARDRRHGR